MGTIPPAAAVLLVVVEEEIVIILFQHTCMYVDIFDICHYYVAISYFS